MNETTNQDTQATHATSGGTDISRYPRWISPLILGSAGILLLPVVRTTWHNVYGARWAYILLASFLISFGLTPLIIRLAHFLRVFDFPAARKVHAEPTPLLGGLAIYLAFVISILANSIFDQQVLAILLVGTILSTCRHPG